MLLSPHEIHVHGPETRERGIHSKFCPELLDFGIVVTGVTDAVYPYAMGHVSSEKTYLVICTAGGGSMLLENREEPFQPGDAYFCKAGTPHAYAALPGQEFHLAWVLYSPDPLRDRDLPGKSIKIAGLDGARAAHAIEGLYQEMLGNSDHGLRHRWAGLIDAHWLQLLTGGGQLTRSRLAPLWEKVHQSLSYPWTIDELARIAGLSSEQLRRISRAETGRSPMMQVRWLRMEQAATLLQTSPLKVETIGQSVGYDSPFTFSAAFKRSTGHSPTEYKSLCGPTQV